MHCKGKRKSQVKERLNSSEIRGQLILDFPQFQVNLGTHKYPEDKMALCDVRKIRVKQARSESGYPEDWYVPSLP